RSAKSKRDRRGGATVVKHLVGSVCPLGARPATHARSHMNTTHPRARALTALTSVALAAGVLLAPAAGAAPEEDLPRVTVVATGGTIAGKAQGRDTFTSYRAGTYPMADMVAQLEPEIGAFADVDVVQFGNS